MCKKQRERSISLLLAVLLLALKLIYYNAKCDKSSISNYGVSLVERQVLVDEC